MRLRFQPFLPRGGIALLLAIGFAASARAQVMISEFMASNATGLQDEDGDRSDWIELYNAGGAAVDLAGWHLTDEAAQPAKWTFPATNLPAGGYLVVFASGKDRAAPRLHANFSLATEGEYLALVRPDGATVEHAYAPAYPAQYADVSYGRQTQGTNATLRAGQAGYLIRRTPGAANASWPAPHPVYADESVAQVDIYISQDDWDGLMNYPWDESYRAIDLRFRHGDIDVAVTNVGIQCRGNTSREKQPRSFNVAFDAFVPDQTLFGLERMNLNSDVNDPATARPKLLNDLAGALGLPVSRANHAALVVHGPKWDRDNYYSSGVFFDAVRNNTEAVDDVFLASRFGNKRGNLYKCNTRTWRATLEKRTPSVGASYVGDGTTYELKYAGAGDESYDDLAAFINLINDTPSDAFPNAIMAAFDVDGFLRNLAFDVLTGNWDDYWVNANNYHLFRHPDTQRWIYIPYDFDNAMGIRWLDADWGTKNIYTWNSLAGDRPNAPLATRILAVPEFKKRFSFYMKQMLDTVYSNATLDPAIFRIRANLTAALPFETGTVTNMRTRERQRYGNDWPYWTYDQFFYSYVDAQGSYNGNVPNDYGITNFIGVRRAAARAQLDVQNIAPILSDFVLAPSRPGTNDSLAVSIRAGDDQAVTNVAFFYSFQGGATQTVSMAMGADGAYAAAVPAFGATGTVRYYVRALDNSNKPTFHPYGGAGYAATVQIGAPSDLVITELNYNPYDLTPAETNAGLTDAQDLEFIEIHNAGSAPLNLTGYKFTVGIGGTFPAFVLGAGEYAVFVKNAVAFRVRYTNAAIRVIGSFSSGNLSNGGETIRFETAAGGVVCSIAYGDKGDWPGRADGTGSSLELLDPAGSYDDPFNWRSSSEYGGSPGAAGLGPDNRVVVNEILSHASPPLCDRIELYNATAGALAIGGWYLSDVKTQYRKYAIPAGTVLPAGGYVVFDETNHFNASGGTSSNDFSLDGAHGGDVYLLQTDARSNLVRFVDHEEFGAAAGGESFGRWPNGSGRLAPMLGRTFGAANDGPRVGPVVISEIMYRPPSGSNQFEFVEIANPGATAVDLTRWRLDTGVAFTFTNGTLPPGGALVVLSFDPNAATNAALLADFKAAYGVTNEILCAGPYAGDLADAGERVRLLRPDVPPTNEPSFYPLLIEDETEYGAAAPWPAEPAGGGASLERLLPAAWGDGSTSWLAANPPTPGASGEPIPTFHLVVVSPHGNPVPEVGAHAIAANTALSNSVPSPVLAGGTRYLCTGWALADHEPASGETNWLTMTLTNDAALTWLWDTNFMLLVGSDPGGAVQGAAGWQAVGARVELEAVASNQCVFAGWTGDTNAIVAGDASTAAISVTMNAPVSLVAHFETVVPTYYVSPAGGNVAPYTNWDTAATSLAAIVSYVPAGATVLVAGATYPLASTLAITGALTLASADGPGAAILDGNHAVRPLLLAHASATVEGFAIQNGNSGASSGGGVRIEPAGRLVNCIVRSNATAKSGGGATLIGGGELRNCLFHGNSADNERGGGIYTFAGAPPPLVENCTFAANSAAEGGGVYLYDDAILRNSIVWGNAADSGSNVAVYGSGQIVQTNLANVAPRFAAAATGDFRLADDSPGVDAAAALPWMAAAVDLDGRPRVIHDRPDVGAYEAILPAWDGDADGLPDAWEWTYSRTLTGMEPDANDDPDRFTNLQELRAGTDPRDGASFLGVKAADTDAGNPGQFVLTWSSATGRHYRIAAGTNPIAGFPAVAYSNIPGRPPANTFTGTLVPPTPAFFRIELE